ncbi:S8 family serine peptidase, partial [Blastococcus atacamensis]|uniref:S8 family serine peptidase n=1 Tax=Blastococcus atacamensis TaxID=2070508 RepID=UPI00130013A2
MTSKRVMGIVLTSAVVAGYAGAAVWSAWAQPSVELVAGYGEGDGLTRYVLTAQPGTAGSDLLTSLDAVPGVASAQWIDGTHALVATDGVAPERLGAVPGIDAVELSPSVPVLGTVTDPYARDYGWNLENTGSNAYQQAAVADADVDATAGWDIGTGHGRVVAVVDTGFDSDHPDLVGSLWTNPRERCGTTDTDGNGLPGDCHGWNFATNSADIDNGSMGTHGTSVSGIVGARANNGVATAGVAPDVTIMPLVIGSGSGVDVVLGAKAIRYAVDNGADVINASWGGQFSGWPLQLLREAVAYAEAHDVLVVAAAGNDSLNRDTSIVYPASLTEPNIVTVGSSTAADTMAAHSAYGAASVDLFAPGELVAVVWNDGGVRVGSGTSYAAPHVAAAVALYRSVMPTASAAELKAALLGDVDPVAAFSGKSVTGGRLTMAGLTDSGATVRYAFTSMTARPGTVTPTIGISTPGGPGTYTVGVGLGMEQDGEIWALSQKAVTLDGVTVPTDDAGDARFDLVAFSDGTALSPSMELAEGRYVLTVQLHRDGEPLGRMHAAPLLVSSSAAPGSPAPGTPTPGTPLPGMPGA